MKKNSQTIIEYGLIIGLIALISMVLLKNFGDSINAVGDKASTSVNTATDSANKEYCENAGGSIVNEQCVFNYDTN